MCWEHYDGDVNSYYEEECSNFMDVCQQLENAGDAVHDLLSVLYGTQPLEVSGLDDIIENLCSALDIKVPPGLPRVRRHVPEFFDIGVELSQTLTHAGV